MRSRRISSWLVAALLLLPAAGAWATPTTYAFLTGQVTITASNSSGLLAPAATLQLDGVQVTIDEMTGEVVSMELTSSDTTTIVLDDPYAGYQDITIHSLSLSGGPGLLIPVDPGPPQEFFFFIDPITLEATIDADGPAPEGGALTDALVESVAPGSGTIFLETGVLTLDGISIGTIGPFGSETEAIELKGDFVFSGAEEVPIPEPTAALVFAFGLAAVAGAHRRGARRATAV